MFGQINREVENQQKHIAEFLQAHAALLEKALEDPETLPEDVEFTIEHLRETANKLKKS